MAPEIFQLTSFLVLRLSSHCRLFRLTNGRSLHALSILSFPRAIHTSRGVQVDTDFIRNKTAVLRVTIEGLPARSNLNRSLFFRLDIWPCLSFINIDTKRGTYSLALIGCRNKWN